MSQYKYTLGVHVLSDPAPVTPSWIRAEIDTFKRTKSLHSLIFPLSLNNSDRRLGHEYAQEIGLLSKTFGEKGVDRHLQIFRSADVIPKKTCGWNEIPRGARRVFENFDISLWIGSGLDARDISQLKSSFGISHIINCAFEWENSNEEGITFETLSIPQKPKLPDDQEEIESAMNDSLEIIDKLLEFNKGQSCTILIHCIDGKSRSCAVMIHYLMKRHGFTLYDAYHRIEKVHSIHLATGLFRFLMLKEMEIYGIHSMNPQDHQPSSPQQQDPRSPVHGKNNPRLSKVQREEICLEWVTKAVMHLALDKSCEGEFEKENIKAFISQVLVEVFQNSSFQEFMKAKDYAWKDISGCIEKYAYGWFMDQIQQEDVFITL